MKNPRKTLEGLAAHLFQLKTGEETMRWLDENLGLEPGGEQVGMMDYPPVN